jgi:hypothetical protein
VDHEVTIRNLSGQIVESFQGKAGEIDHAFTTNVRGVLLIGIKTATGITHLQVSRI